MPISKMEERTDARKKAEEQKAKKKANRSVKITAKTSGPAKKNAKSAKRK